MKRVTNVSSVTIVQKEKIVTRGQPMKYEISEVPVDDRSGWRWVLPWPSSVRMLRYPGLSTIAIKVDLPMTRYTRTHAKRKHEAGWLTWMAITDDTESS